MKLDHDLVRHILLAIESNENISGPDGKELLASVSKRGYGNLDEIAYSILKLKEANYITGEVSWGDNKPTEIIPGNLTFEGHQFLDNIRDDSVWKDTKKVLSKFSSVSLTFVSSVASSVITQLIKQQIGI